MLIWLNDGNVVNIKIEPVGAVEVADGHIALATIGTQVDSVFIIGTRGTVATAACHARTSFAATLGSHRPFLDGGEVIGIGVARGGYGQAKVLARPICILCAGPEGDAATKFNKR